MLKELNNALNKSWHGKTLIIKDPIKLATGGDPSELFNEIKVVLHHDGNVKVERSIPIIAISVNPFYPKYRFDKNNYEPAFVNSEKLLIYMKNAVPITIVDVKKNGCIELIEALKAFINQYG